MMIIKLISHSKFLHENSASAHHNEIGPFYISLKYSVIYHWNIPSCPGRDESLTHCGYGWVCVCVFLAKWECIYNNSLHKNAVKSLLAGWSAAQWERVEWCRVNGWLSSLFSLLSSFTIWAKRYTCVYDVQHNFMYFFSFYIYGTVH